MSSVITEPSICIPRALANVTWKDVKDIFEKLIGVGSIERVDLVRSKNDDQFCRIFVHFRSWPVNKPEIADMRDKLLAGDTIKLVYDNPWFWKCVKSRIPKPERTRERQAPFIMNDAEPNHSRLRTLDDFVEDERCDSHTGKVSLTNPPAQEPVETES
jgi:hypothetical protein